MKLELIKAFSRRSRAVAAKKCKKKRDTRAKLLFYQSKPIAFCRSRSRRRRRCFSPLERFYLIGHTERSYAQTQKLEPLFKTLTFTLRANSKGLRIAVTCMVIQ